MKTEKAHPIADKEINEQISKELKREKEKYTAMLKRVRSDLGEANEHQAAQVLDEILNNDAAQMLLLDAVSRSEALSRWDWKRLKDFERLAAEAAKITDRLRDIHHEVLKAHIEVRSDVDTAIQNKDLGPFSPEKVLLKGGWPLIDAADSYATAISAMAQVVAKKSRSGKDGGGATAWASPGAKANQTPREILALGIAKSWDAVDPGKPYRRGSVPIFVALLGHIHKRLLGKPPSADTLEADVTFARRR